VTEVYQTGHVAMWVVVGSYGMAWLGAVLVWQRRKARVMRMEKGSVPGDQ